MREMRPKSCAIFAKGVDGVVHAANGGSCTWYEFAKTALALCDLPPLIERSHERFSDPGPPS